MNRGCISRDIMAHRGKMFIGGLTKDTNSNLLRDYFQEFGDLAEVIVKLNPDTGKSRGFGFVTFKNPLCVETVLISGPHFIDNKEIEAQACLPKHMRPPPQRDAEEISRHRIFVGGFPKTLREDELKNCFNNYGTVTECYIMYDEKTRQSRGFGFVTFSDELVARDLCTRRFVMLYDKIKVEIKAATQRMNANIPLLNEKCVFNHQSSASSYHSSKQPTSDATQAGDVEFGYLSSGHNDDGYMGPSTSKSNFHDTFEESVAYGSCSSPQKNIAQRQPIASGLRTSEKVQIDKMDGVKMFVKQSLSLQETGFLGNQRPMINVSRERSWDLAKNNPYGLCEVPSASGNAADMLSKAHAASQSANVTQHTRLADNAFDVTSQAYVVAKQRLLVDVNRADSGGLGGVDDHGYSIGGYHKMSPSSGQAADKAIASKLPREPLVCKGSSIRGVLDYLPGYKSATVSVAGGSFREHSLVVARDSTKDYEYPSRWTNGINLSTNNGMAASVDATSIVQKRKSHDLSVDRSGDQKRPRQSNEYGDLDERHYHSEATTALQYSANRYGQ